jgi:succinate dehydrogenase / fumarate reductase cytochrome b subunit
MAEAKSLRGARPERPLSPHLQVYSPPINMTMSILHRITGGALYFGSLLLVWWLVAAASGPGYFDFVNGIFGSLIGRLVLFGYTWALMLHMLGGIRHFIWDTGRGYDLKTIDRLSWGSAVVSVALTGLIWLVVLVSG